MNISHTPKKVHIGFVLLSLCWTTSFSPEQPLPSTNKSKWKYGKKDEKKQRGKINTAIMSQIMDIKVLFEVTKKKRWHRGNLKSFFVSHPVFLRWIYCHQFKTLKKNKKKTISGCCFPPSLWHRLGCSLNLHKPAAACFKSLLAIVILAQGASLKTRTKVRN